MKALLRRLGDFPASLWSSTRSPAGPLPLGWQPGVLGPGALAHWATGKASPELARVSDPTRIACASEQASLICNLQGD